MRKLLESGLPGRTAENPRAEMPFLDHLEELRWRVLWSLLAVVVCAVAGLLAVQYLDVLTLLNRPYHEVFGEDQMLIYLAPADSFFIYLKVSLTIGIVLASPIVVYQVWAFLSPALEKHEKRAVVPALYMGLVLFAAGVTMAYFVLPRVLGFLSGFMSDFMEASYTASGYIAFVVRLLLAFGIVFELPVVVMILSALGLVTPAFLRAKRRWAIVGITVLAAVLSPGDVVFVTVMMMVPLFFLYEFSILLSELIWRKRRKSAGEAEPARGAGLTLAPEESVAATDEPASATPYTHGDPALERDEGDKET